MRHQLRSTNVLLLLCFYTFFFAASPTIAGENDGRENASNPLAKGKNTDLRWQYFDTGNGHISDFYIDGAFMANAKFKVTYKLHYWETNVTGSGEDDWESLSLKGIYIPADGTWGNLKYRVAFGMEWLPDLGDKDKGIGSGADQIAPLAGVALGFKAGTMAIPLIQHFLSYSGEDVNTTSFRMVVLQPLPWQTWLKLDAKLPIDWENDEAIPATAELQFGKNIDKSFAIYVDGLVGIGGDKPYEWGIGTGLRFKY